MSDQDQSLPNLFIMGSGRSGTSMVAGLFRNAGYFMGSKLHAPRHSNPMGFFEDAAVNNVNEEILTPYVPAPVHRDGIVYQADAPGPGQKWLARLSPDTNISATPEQLDVIAGLAEISPFVSRIRDFPTLCTCGAPMPAIAVSSVCFATPPKLSRAF